MDVFVYSEPIHPPTDPMSGLHRRPRSSSAEAPDRGVREREAPETQVGRPLEAPDAGEARTADGEHDFTCGRSQS